MSNKTETKTATFRNTKAISKARRNRTLISIRAFKQLHKGTITMRKTSEVYFCGFTSIITGKRSHAWGKDFPTAYRNMLRCFHVKYA